MGDERYLVPAFSDSFELVQGFGLVLAEFDYGCALAGGWSWGMVSLMAWSMRMDICSLT